MSRSDRLRSQHPGAWATSSQDYASLATQLYALSANAASGNSKQASSYVFAGLPLLFSALRALLIECNSGIFGVERDLGALAELAASPNELSLLRTRYGFPQDLLAELQLLYEVRNELVHPAHRPAGTPDSTPDYLRPLKERGVLVTTGDPRSDYPFMAQLQSHRLFRFSFDVVERTVAHILATHRAHDRHFDCPFLATYQHYKVLAA